MHVTMIAESKVCIIATADGKTYIRLGLWEWFKILTIPSTLTNRHNRFLLICDDEERIKELEEAYVNIEARKEQSNVNKELK